MPLLTPRLVTISGLSTVACASLLIAGPVSSTASPPPGQEESATTTVKVVPVASREAEAVHRIDLALCLDTSGSMDGLLESAKQELWDIVNNFALAKPTPTLRVALLTYGNDGYVSENGWVQVDCAFTEDLDEVSKQLFSKTTNGGTELVGRVIHESLEQLDWTAGDAALKVIVVAGNESANQDQTFDYRKVCSASINRGIMVNAIYCGDVADNIAPGWREVATLADGHFAAIDQANGNIVISTPFDDELVDLSSAINATYIPYGEVGAEFAEKQWAQDNNAQQLSNAAAAQRCQTKAGALYKNSQWDLVDACREKVVKIEEIKTEDLPENMQSMTVAERKAYVEQQQARRHAIQKEVEQISARRIAFVQSERKKMSPDHAVGFDAAMINALQSQAESKGFAFEPLEAPAPVDTTRARLEVFDGTTTTSGTAPLAINRTPEGSEPVVQDTKVRFSISLDGATTDESSRQDAYDGLTRFKPGLVLKLESDEALTAEANLSAFACKVKLNGVERTIKVRVTRDATMLMRYKVRGAIDPADFGIEMNQDGQAGAGAGTVLVFEMLIDLGC